ncbi:MAG TPA: glycoside hydrolase family 3 N-terminal domain-containing protein [Gemmatimonadales bacterium]|jgi:beta-N-acetylhexosaminidase|nr:glycoside hydrolase family 3 N-terminal domain-containing protein [Gemmatimonadales bacterium]
MRAHKLLIVMLLTAACGGRTTTAPATPKPVATDAVLAKLTPRQKIAQLVVPWLGGNYMALDDSAFQIATRWVDTLEVGGIIISVGSPYDIAAKLNTLQRRSKLPLLVSADLEWGAAMRVVGATAFPMIMSAGATGDERDAYTIGRIAALEGRAVGIHVNFAPDADVNNNPLNPIINTRSFGEDPRAVARLVRAYVRGLQENGMLATLKHFPGHGDTDADSHIGLPTIRADYPRLDSVELVPFRAGIDAGAQVVMSAHIAFPAFTGDAPATLSPAMLTGVLRDSLKFKGLVVTDALQMGAIVAKYGAGEAAVRAFEAGSDLLLMPADPDSAIASMLTALQTGRITTARLDASVRRVLEIKRGLGLFARRTVPLDSIARIVGSKAFSDAADDIAQRSLTLVRDTAGTIARLRNARSRMAVIAYGDELNSYVGQRMLELLRLGGDTVGFFRLWPMSGSASYDSARVVIGRAPTVIFAMNVRPIAAKGNIALPDSLARLITMTDSVKPTVLVSLGSPYLLNQTPTVKSYLIAWSGVRPAERAAARALLGWSPLRGKLPIRIPPAYPIGYGLTVSDSTLPPPRPPAHVIIP